MANVLVEFSERGVTSVRAAPGTPESFAEVVELVRACAPEIAELNLKARAFALYKADFEKRAAEDQRLMDLAGGKTRI